MTNAEFAKVVGDWISVDHDSRCRALAVEFEAAWSIADRWASGSAKPHPHIQAQIIRWIEEHQ